MSRLANLSLANRALIALITVFAAIFGVVAMGSLKQELIPSLELPQVSVVTSFPGASAEVVDAQISRPLEAALNGVENLDSSSATSRSGFSTISLSFPYGTNLDRARSQIDRAIANVKAQLPDGVNPQSLAGSVSDFPIVYFAVSSDQSLSELGQNLSRIAVTDLRKVDGVRDVQVTGTTGQHIEIAPDQQKLAAAGVSVSAIADALKNNGTLVPAGSLTQDSRTLSIQVGSPIDSLDAIRALPLSGKAGGVPPTIGSVASVSLKDDPATSITRTNGKQTLALSITKKPDADTVTVARAIHATLPNIEASLGHNVQFTTIFDQAPFIEKSINDLGTEGLLGLGFAVLVILLFLLSVRSTIVTAISIPLSLLITLIGIWAAHYSLNILTLGALTIAIGRVVDDSIVVIENIKRHQGYGEPKLVSIKKAIAEVAGAITASTLTTIAVFLPIAFVGDIAGELFRPFALTVTIALLASLLVSLTIVPVLAYWFLGSSKSTEPTHVSAAADFEKIEDKERKSRLQRGYLPILRTTQKHPVITVIAAGVILLGTLAMTPLLPQNLLSDSGQNSFSVTQTLPVGSSLDTTSQAAKKVEDALTGVDGIQAVQVTAGNSSDGFAAFSASGTNVATFQVVTDESKNQVALKDAVRRKLGQLSDAGQIQISSQGGGFGTSTAVAVDVKASDSTTLAEASDAVLNALKDVPGGRDISSNLAANNPIVQISIDRSKVVAAGLNEQQVAGILASTISPITAGTVRIDTTDYKVQIGQGTQFSSVQALAQFSVPTSSGSVPLSSLASVQQVNVPASITVSDGQRSARVSVSPTGDDLGKLSSEVQKRIAGVHLPQGATATIGGAATQQRDAFAQLGLALLAAIAIVYVVMVATFKSLIQPLLLLVSVPFAATGAIALLLVTRVPLGLASLIGLLMLIGIVVTNAIVLVDLINQARRGVRGLPPMNVSRAIEYGARHRLRPILMTALATVFALIPMGLGLTGGGSFISQPLAIVVIGGLVSSTALTLILVPVLYRLVEGARERRRLLAELHQKPVASSGEDAATLDWTTGAIPAVRGRRSAGAGKA